MLNELNHLSIALTHAGITPPDWHNDMKSLPNVKPKKPCYKILIGSDGSISGIEAMGKQLVSSLRKCQFGSNGYSFPGFNIQSLYYITGEEEKKCLEKWNKGKDQIDTDKLQQWCIEKNETRWNEPMLNECLGKIPQELKRQLGEIPDDFIALNKLFERVDKAWGNDGCAKFVQALKNYIWGKISVNENLSFLLPILIRTKPKPENISIFLDVPDWMEYPVANKYTIALINERLLQADRLSCSQINRKTNDAYGLCSSGCDDKLSDTKLPFLGKVILRAMSSESPCQRRYGTIDAKSFCIGAESRRRAKSALEWIGDEKHEGQTWGRADGKESIFAYPAIIPPEPPALAAFFGARKTDDKEARFEKYAEDVVTSLKGLSPSLKDIELRVFSLRKMDNTSAKTKVIFHRNYSAQRLADAATEWQQGSKNIPKIQITAWGKGKGEIIHAEPETPFPLQIADCLNRVWKLDGTTASEVKTIHKSDGIELLLDEMAIQRRIPHLLAVTIQNSKGLFFSLGQSMHRDEVLKLDGFNKHKQLMPSILGILLWKLGIGKEIYMNNPSYLVGRILKIADELHALYCKEVRKDKMPPQLLGNALMAAALDSPTQALAQLALRIVPYLGWARTNASDSAKLSRYFLKEFGLIEAKLRDAVLPSRLDDAAKAQLLLGYISSNSQTDENTKI